MKFYTAIFCFFKPTCWIGLESVREGVFTDVTDFCTWSFDVNFSVVHSYENADEEVEVKWNEGLNIATISIRSPFDRM